MPGNIKFLLSSFSFFVTTCKWASSLIDSTENLSSDFLFPWASHPGNSSEQLNMRSDTYIHHFHLSVSQSWGHWRALFITMTTLLLPGFISPSPLNAELWFPSCSIYHNPKRYILFLSAGEGSGSNKPQIKCGFLPDPTAKRTYNPCVLVFLWPLTQV